MAMNPLFEIKGNSRRCCPKCLLQHIPNRIRCACTAPFAVCGESRDKCEAACPLVLSTGDLLPRQPKASSKA